MQIGIIGAGHAGIAAAEAAAAMGASATVFSAERELPYFRPRLVAMAVGQAKIEQLHMHPADWYSKKGIELQLGVAVQELNTKEHAVVVNGQRKEFDALVFAAGSVPSLPPFFVHAPEGVLPLWNAEHAKQICDRLAPGKRLVVIGGGILGVEAALRALEQKMSVTVIERMPRLMLNQLGGVVSTHLAETLRTRGAEILLEAEVGSVRKTDQGLSVVMKDGREITGAVVVVSTGARRNLLLAEKARLQVEQGIVVDCLMKTSASGVYACGDVITFSGLNRPSVIDAVKQGKVAGANAAGASLEYAPQSTPMSYKQGAFELSAVGPVDEAAAERREISVPGGCGVLVVKNGLVCGVQVIGSLAVFREYEKKLGKPL